MKRARPIEAPEQQNKKLNYLDERNCWEELPLELRARVYTLLATPPHHSYILVSKEWNEQITYYFQSVTSLNLAPYTSSITDDVFFYISKNFCKVQKLIIDKLGVKMPITEDGLRHMINFEKLHSLNLIDCKLSCVTIKLLAKYLPTLASINMTWCAVQDDCVGHFALFKQLRHLSLQNSPHVSDIGVMQLMKLHQLASLNLSFCCGITDFGLTQVVDKLKNIESLNLSWCSEVTDVTLLHIGTRLPRLRVLYLTGCRKISMDGKNFIRRNLPDCKVFSDSNYIPFKCGIQM